MEKTKNVLFQPLKNDLHNKEIKRLVRDTVIIFLFSFITAVLIIQHLSIEKDTLFWLGSSIVMAFGAMFAIVLFLSGNQYQITSEILKRDIQVLKEIFKLTGEESNSNRKYQDAIVKKFFESLNKYSEDKEIIFYKLHRTIQSLALLIACGIISIIINGSIENQRYLLKNFLRLFFSLFLLIYSFYCMQILISRIYDVIRLQKKNN